MAVAKRHRYDYTADELKAAIEAKKDSLTEEKLERIAGGVPEPTAHNIYDAAVYVGLVGLGPSASAVLISLTLRRSLDLPTV